MIENYLMILEESLQKKLAVLKKIQDYNLKQQEIFQSGKPELSAFDEAMQEKEALIEEVNSLDNGFETLYERVAAQLKTGKEQYADSIRRLQELVKQVMEESVAVQAQEARNKQLIEQYFAKERQAIKQGRKTSKAALDYYRNMSNSGHVPPQFMDSKN